MRPAMYSTVFAAISTLHGADGLKEFTQARAITKRRIDLGMEFASFQRAGWVFGLAEQAMKLVHGRHTR